MEDIFKLIAEYGVLVILAGAFIYFRWQEIKRFDKHLAEFLEQVKEFASISASFANVMANHVHDNTDAMREMTKALEHVCYLIGIRKDDLTR